MMRFVIEVSDYKPLRKAFEHDDFVDRLLTDIIERSFRIQHVLRHPTEYAVQAPRRLAYKVSRKATVTVCLTGIVPGKRPVRFFNALLKHLEAIVHQTIENALADDAFVRHCECLCALQFTSYVKNGRNKRSTCLNGAIQTISP